MYDGLVEEENESEIVIFEDESHAVYQYKREESGWPKSFKDPDELFLPLNPITLLTHEKPIVRSWMKHIVKES